MEYDYRFLDHVRHPVFVLDLSPDGAPCYAWFNQTARSIIGKPLEDILGVTAAELYPGRLGRIAMAHHRRAFESGKASTYEITLPIGGAEKLIRTTLDPVLAPSGRVDRIVGTSNDISDTKLLSSAQSELDSLRHEIEQFVHLAAHDLRTPMRHVAAIADMLRDDFQDLGDGKLALIGVLEEVGTKAMALIADVLEHAQSASSVREDIRFGFSDLALEVMGLLDPHEACAVDVRAADLRTDRAALQTILRNLIDNAIKNWESACPPHTDGAKLVIEFKVAQTSPDLLAFSIRDNGTGLSSQALRALGKDRFTSEGGYGLIAIRRLIAARGGELWVENRKDQTGADIRFTLRGEVVTLPQDAPCLTR